MNDAKVWLEANVADRPFVDATGELIVNDGKIMYQLFGYAPTEVKDIATFARMVAEDWEDDREILGNDPHAFGYGYMGDDCTGVVLVSQFLALAYADTKRVTRCRACSRPVVNVGRGDQVRWVHVLPSDHAADSVAR